MAELIGITENEWKELEALRKAKGFVSGVVKHCIAFHDGSASEIIRRSLMRDDVPGWYLYTYDENSFIINVAGPKAAAKEFLK